MAERETEAAFISIHDSIFSVANFSGFVFLDSTGKFITISDPINRPRDVSYFTFSSSLKPNTVDPRAPQAVYQFGFTLLLPHNYSSSSANISLPSTSIVTNVLLETIFNAVLIGLSDDKLDTMLATDLPLMLFTQRDSISTSATSTTSRSLTFSTPDYSTTKVATTSTPKMDMVRSPSSVGSTYYGPLDFLDDQSSSDNIFGLAPDMLPINTRSSRAIEESDTLRLTLDTICSLSQLYIFFNIVQLQYVGTDTYDSNQMMSNISHALSTLKLEFQLRGKILILPLTISFAVISNIYPCFHPMP